MKNIIVGIMALFIAGCGCSPNYSNGERIGVVTKISKKGLLLKSWEAEAVIALPPSVGGYAQPEIFAFNVDEDAVQAVQDAAASGQRVKLIYRQWAFSPPSIDHDHVVYRVESIAK